MDIEEKVKEFVYNAIDTVNQMGLADQKVEKSPRTVLIGKKATIDSMAIVSLIVAVEEQLQDEFDSNLSLADPAALSAENSAFETVSSFITYVSNLLKEKGYV